MTDKPPSQVHQARWLEQKKWRYVVTKDNRPKVLRDYLSERMGGRLSHQVNQLNALAATKQPNFAAINRR